MNVRMGRPNYDPLPCMLLEDLDTMIDADDLERDRKIAEWSRDGQREHLTKYLPQGAVLNFNGDLTNVLMDDLEPDEWDDYDLGIHFGQKSGDIKEAKNTKAEEKIMIPKSAEALAEEIFRSVVFSRK